MALVTFSGGIFFPSFPSEINSAAPAFGSMLVDALTEGCAAIIMAPSTGYVESIGINVGSIGLAGTVTVSLETVSLTDGNPTGTLYATGASGFLSLEVADSQSWKNVSMGTQSLIHQGSFISVVVRNTAVYAGTGLFNFRRFSSSQYEFPYTDLFTGSWTKSPISPIVSLQYLNSSYVSTKGAWAIEDLVGRSLGTESHNALKFTNPFPCRAIGAWVQADIDAECNIRLYANDASTILTKVVMDNNVRQSTVEGINIVTFAQAVTLLAATSYRLSYSGTFGTSVVRNFVVNTAALLNTFEGGMNYHLSTANLAPTGESSWADLTNQRPWMGLIYDQFDDGVSAGGGNDTKITIGLSQRAQI